MKMVHMNNNFKGVLIKNNKGEPSAGTRREMGLQLPLSGDMRQSIFLNLPIFVHQYRWITEIYYYAKAQINLVYSKSNILNHWGESTLLDE